MYKQNLTVTLGTDPVATAEAIRKGCLSCGASEAQADEAAAAAKEAIEGLIARAHELRAVGSSFEATRPVRTPVCDIRIKTAFRRRGLLARLLNLFRRS